METSDLGIEFIKKQEGVKLAPYKDSVGLLTIGVGHRITSSEISSLNAPISVEKCDELLKSDLVRFETAVNSVNDSLEQYQFDACCSLAFNIGASAFVNSTLATYLRQGDMSQAASEFPKWSKQIALLPRRLREQQLFINGTY